MATVTTDSQNYSDIADAIRAKGISGSFMPAQMANAVSQIQGGGGSIVTGTFTLPSSIAGGIISHNANIDGEYIFLAVMQPASFETLKSSGSTQNYAIAFFALCTASLNDFASGSASSYVNKNGVRWSFNPSGGTFGGGISAANPILADANNIHYYTPKKIQLAGNFGYHKGTYDFWAIPLN